MSLCSVMHQVHKVTQWGCFNQSDDMIMVLKSKFAFGFLISIWYCKSWITWLPSSKCQGVSGRGSLWQRLSAPHYVLTFILVVGSVILVKDDLYIQRSVTYPPHFFPRNYWMTPYSAWRFLEARQVSRLGANAGIRGDRWALGLGERNRKQPSLWR